MLIKLNTYYQNLVVNKKEIIFKVNKKSHGLQKFAL